MAIKSWNSALGAQMHCPNFAPCPLCYGCRNYDSAVVRCEKCENANSRQNICDTGKHTEKALGLMLRIKNKARI